MQIRKEFKSSRKFEEYKEFEEYKDGLAHSLGGESKAHAVLVRPKRSSEENS